MFYKNQITHDEVEIFVHLFKMYASYINIDAIPYKDLQEFLSRDYIREADIDNQLDLCSDWCMANQLCEVQE